MKSIRLTNVHQSEKEEMDLEKGRRTIGSLNRTTTHSKRARKTDLEIKKYDVPICCFCGHNKTLINTKFEKCSRCKCIIRRFK